MNKSARVPVTNKSRRIKVLSTTEELRGLLLANTIQQPKSITCFSTAIVSELAEQSTNVKPVVVHTKNEVIVEYQANIL